MSVIIMYKELYKLKSKSDKNKRIRQKSYFNDAAATFKVGQGH